jgi:hypothetical protein
MWRAALPGRRAGCALLALTPAAAVAVAAPAKSSTTAASGRIWAVAYPGSVDAVASARRARLTVLAPRAKPPRTPCRPTSRTLLACAALALTRSERDRRIRRHTARCVPAHAHRGARLQSYPERLTQATHFGDDASPIQWRCATRWLLDGQHGERRCAAPLLFATVVNLTCNGLSLLVEGGIA